MKPFCISRLEARSANRFLLREMAEHFRLVENPANLPFDPSAVQALHYDLFGSAAAGSIDSLLLGNCRQDL